MNFIFALLWSQLLLSSLPFSFALNATIFVSPNLPDTPPLPANCYPPSNDQCNLRSAMQACSSYLIDISSSCVISLSPNDQIHLNPSLGEIQITLMIGHLLIYGHGSSISPLQTNTTLTPMRFLTAISSSALNPLSLTISNTSFSQFSLLSNTQSTNQGGVIFLQLLSSITFTHLSFINNSAPYGGALSLDSCSNIQISSSSFFFNHAEQDGGAIHLLSLNTDILITHSFFKHNQATSSPSSTDSTSRGQGGAISFDSLNTNIHITHTLFDSNEGMNGGAVYFHNDNHVILIASCRFQHNHASFGGGVMFYNQNLLVTVQDTIFDSNTATTFYGK
jgi:predicted outer membrane repeat protein